MGNIVISHESAAGTVVSGDTRQYKDTIKSCGFRWGRTLGAWYLPNSRDRLPQMGRIQRLADALTAAGATVETDVSSELASIAEREANRNERIADRQVALEAKAARKAAESDAQYQRAHDLVANIPFGQPILVGHHSEKAHRNTIAKSHRAMDKSVEAMREAEAVTERLAGSIRQAKHRESDPATIRRIERMETELRKLDRNLRCTANERWAAQMRERRTVLIDDIAYWNRHLDELKAAGFHQWSATDFSAGDLVKTRFGWRRIVRVNAKTLSVETAYSWADKVPYDEVSGVEHAV